LEKSIAFACVHVNDFLTKFFAHKRALSKMFEEQYDDTEEYGDQDEYQPVDDMDVMDYNQSDAANEITSELWQVT
jgi:hypothetical protein